MTILVCKMGVIFFVATLVKVFGKAVWIIANAPPRLQPEQGAWKCEGGFGSLQSRHPLYKLSHLVGNSSNLAKRKFERGREGGGKKGREDGQRLPHRAWSCDCEKRLLRCLQRNPQTEEGFYLTVRWDWKRQQKVISREVQRRGSERGKGERSTQRGETEVDMESLGVLLDPGCEINWREGATQKRQNHKTTTKHKHSPLR